MGHLVRKGCEVGGGHRLDHRLIGLRVRALGLDLDASGGQS